MTDFYRLDKVPRLRLGPIMMASGMGFPIRVQRSVLRLPVASLFPLDNADLRTVIACYDKDLFGWWCFFFIKGDLNKGCVDAKNFSGAECVGLRPSVGHDEEEGRLCALLFRDDFGPNNPK